MFICLLSVYLFSFVILMPAYRAIPAPHTLSDFSGCWCSGLQDLVALAPDHIRLLDLSYFTILSPACKTALLGRLALA